MGCNGGQIATPWNWFKNKGTVSGGFEEDSSSDYCYNYTMPKCNHHVTGSTYPDCTDVTQVNPTCKKTCTDSET
jgi:cathepsin B